MNMTIITAKTENKNNKMKRLVQSIKYKKIHANIIYLPRYYFLVSILLLTKMNYFKSRCKKNKSLVLLMDGLNILSVHDIIQRLVPATYL